MAVEEYLGFLAKAIFLILVVIVIVILAQQVSSGVSEKAGGLANWFQQCILCSIWNFLAEFFSQWWVPTSFQQWGYHLMGAWTTCAFYSPDKPLIYVKDLNLTISDDDESKNKLAEEVADCIIECAKKARCPDVICCIFTGVDFQTDYPDFECRVTYYLYEKGYCGEKIGIFDSFSNIICGGSTSCDTPMGRFDCIDCRSESGSILNMDNIVFTGIFADGVQSGEEGCIYVFLNRWTESLIPGVTFLPYLTKEIVVGDEKELWRVSCQSSARKMAIYCKK